MLPDSGTTESCTGRLGTVLDALTGLQQELLEVQQGFPKMQVRASNSFVLSRLY